MHDDDNDEGLWANEDSEGLFDDRESIFDEARRVDSDNPLISRTEDARMHSPPTRVGGSTEPVALVAVFDERGEPRVARHKMQGGKPVQVEEFRRPTADEYNSIMFGGKIVRGGVVAENVSTSTHLGPTMMKTPLGQVHAERRGLDWKKVGLYAVGSAAVIGGGWYAYRWWQERE